MPTQWIEIPVKDIIKASWNYKTNDKKLSEKLEKNIENNGIIQNLIVRQLGDKYEVVNGNHRLEIANKLKLEKVMCYNLGDIPEISAKRIAIETNETNFIPDEMKLAHIINELSQEYSIDDLLASMPYDKQDFEGFSELSNFDWDDFAGKGSDEELEDKVDEELEDKVDEDEGIDDMLNDTYTIEKVFRINNITNISMDLFYVIDNTIKKLVKNNNLKEGDEKVLEIILNHIPENILKGE